MWRDEIVEQIHKVRREQAARFNYDISAMLADAKKRQDERGRHVVSFRRHGPQIAQVEQPEGKTP